jgi:hypothetical protein
MNTTHSMKQAHVDPEAQAHAQARFALRVCAHLHDSSGALPSDISERLRFARQQALERARQARCAAEGVTITPARTGQTSVAIATLSAGGPGAGHSGARSAWATWGDDDGDSDSRWWMRLGVVLPALVLILGLIWIQHHHDQNQIAAVAELDAALLTDALPPEAYGDVGFLEFLKDPSAANAYDTE